MFDQKVLDKYGEIRTLYKCLNEYQDNLKRFKGRYSIMHFLMNSDFNHILEYLIKDNSVSCRLGILAEKQNAFEIGLLRNKHLQALDLVKNLNFTHFFNHENIKLTD